MKKLLGRGTFTRAYLLESGEVELHSIDPVKECLALWGFGDSQLWPKIERIDYIDGVGVYRMPRYEKPKSLKKALNAHDWEFYKALRALPCSIGFEKESELKNRWHEKFDTLKNQFSDYVEALHEALDSLGNYGFDICFEISPRNVAVKDGNLILLDCFFLRSKLREAKDE